MFLQSSRTYLTHRATTHIRPQMHVMKSIIQASILFILSIFFVGALLGLLGYIFPKVLPFLAFIMGFILLTYSLRLLSPIGYWQVLFPVLGIIVISSFAANLVHNVLCYSQINQFLGSVKANCLPNSVGATTLAVVIFIGISSIGMFVILLWGQTRKNS